MASLASEIQTWMNANLPVHIDFNVTRPKKTDPWYTMVITAAENEKHTLCDTDGGEMVIQVQGYGSQRYDVYDDMEAIRQDIENNMRNSVANYSVWNVQTSGTISAGTIDNQMNGYAFDIAVTWSV